MGSETPFMDIVNLLRTFNSKSVPVGYVAAKFSVSEQKMDKMLDMLEKNGADLYRKDGYVALVQKAAAP